MKDDRDSENANDNLAARPNDDIAHGAGQRGFWATKTIVINVVGDLATDLELLEAQRATADHDGAMKKHQRGCDNDCELLAARQVFPCIDRAIVHHVLLLLFVEFLHVRILWPVRRQLVSLLRNHIGNCIHHEKGAPCLQQTSCHYKACRQCGQNGLLPRHQDTLESPCQHRGHDTYKDHRCGAQKHLGYVKPKDSAHHAYRPIGAAH
mmetsp:Transcript_57115/g.167200  ORF Transcript_57115/g.167200 Transcript_57115/m.167200 type:complete len:208 (+) Transcript_57115:248-871(+)